MSKKNYCKHERADPYAEPLEGQLIWDFMTRKNVGKRECMTNPQIIDTINLPKYMLSMSK